MWLKRSLVGGILPLALLSAGFAAEPTTEESREARSNDVSSPIPPTDPRPPTGVEEELDFITPGVKLKREFDRIAEKVGFDFIWVPIKTLLERTNHAKAADQFRKAVAIAERASVPDDEQIALYLVPGPVDFDQLFRIQS